MRCGNRALHRERDRIADQDGAGVGSGAVGGQRAIGRGRPKSADLVADIGQCIACRRADQRPVVQYRDRRADGLRVDRRVDPR